MGSVLLQAIGALVSGLVAFVIWMGLAELILVLIAIERNSRQTRDRLPKHRSDF
jgi:hypothetical protein